MDIPEDSAARLQLVHSLHDIFVRGDFDDLAKALGPSPRWYDELLPMELHLGTPLNLAIEWSPFDLIVALLDAGANSNACDEYGFTALFKAIEHPRGTKRPDQLEIIRLLISRGADPNGRGIHNHTPLHHAVVCRNVPAIELLLAEGSDVTLPYLIDLRSTPLDMARLYAFTEGIALLEAAQD
jgi:ankyrin repeat protein